MMAAWILLGINVAASDGCNDQALLFGHCWASTLLHTISFSDSNFIPLSVSFFHFVEFFFYFDHFFSSFSGPLVLVMGCRQQAVGKRAVGTGSRHTGWIWMDSFGYICTCAMRMNM